MFRICLKHPSTSLDQHFHPLDGETTSAFFRDFVQRHWKDGRFVEATEEVDDGGMNRFAANEIDGRRDDLEVFSRDHLPEAEQALRDVQRAHVGIDSRDHLCVLGGNRAQPVAPEELADLRGRGSPGEDRGFDLSFDECLRGFDLCESVEL